MSDTPEICPECGSPVTTPRNRPLSVEDGVCPTCGQNLQAGGVQAVDGPDTSPDELSRRIEEYGSELARLQTRRKQTGQRLSHEEAVKLVRQFPWLDPESPEDCADVALAFYCVIWVDGQAMLIEEHIQQLFEAWQDENAESWERFQAQEALKELVQLQGTQKDHPLIAEIIQRLENGRLNRPSGRYDPRTSEIRYLNIISAIMDLQRLGVNPARNEVTDEHHSACDAVADARDMSYDTVETVWKRRER